MFNQQKLFTITIIFCFSYVDVFLSSTLNYSLVLKMNLKSHSSNNDNNRSSNNNSNNDNNRSSNNNSNNDNNRSSNNNNDNKTPAEEVISTIDNKSTFKNIFFVLFFFFLLTRRVCCARGIRPRPSGS